ncbi:MAG: hypothetical protein C0172_04180 [Caldisphaera sp.]|nr:MAG: hypothetical protein C0201_02920 [Caldisphaera sp.]PMP87810.1 MAG: hypothetical protein C0172_04180 [Caldisphaera sp.]
MIILSLSLIKKKSEDLYKKIKWQEINDSPTTKNYTDWSQFEKYINKNDNEIRYEKPEGDFDIIVGSCGNKGSKDLYESLIKFEESKLTAYHFYKAEEIYSLNLKSGKYRIAFCYPISSSWVSQHLKINIEEGSNTSIVIYEKRDSPGSTAIEINALKDSNNEISIILDSNEIYPTAYLIRKALHNNVEMKSFTLSKSSIMNRVEEKVVLFENSKLKHNLLNLSYKGFRSDNIIDTIQTGLGSISEVSGLGFAFNSSLSSVRGTAIIMPEAKKSRSSFNIEALLFGDNAKAYTMPMMKIETGDVISANHRSAQYRLNEEILFYLESRGIDVNEITSLLVYEKSLGMTGHLDAYKEFVQNIIIKELKKIYK